MVMNTICMLCDFNHDKAPAASRPTPSTQVVLLHTSHFRGTSRHAIRCRGYVWRPVSRVVRVLVAHARGIVRREMPPRRIPHVTRIPH